MVPKQDSEVVLLRKMIACTIDKLSIEDMKNVIAITNSQMDTEEVRQFIIDNLSNHSHALGSAILAIEGKEDIENRKNRGKKIVSKRDDGDVMGSDVSRKRNREDIDLFKVEDPQIHTSSSSEYTPSTTSTVSGSILSDDHRSTLIDWAAENSILNHQTPSQQETSIANIVIQFCNAYDSIIQDLCRNEDPGVIPGYIVRLGTLASNMLEAKKYISRDFGRKFLVGQVMNKLRDTMVTICKVLTKAKAKKAARGLGEEESKEVRRHLLHVDGLLRMRFGFDAYGSDVNSFIEAF